MKNKKLKVSGKFVQIPLVAYRCPELFDINDKEFLLLQILKGYCTTTKTSCYPSISELARQLSYCVDDEGKCRQISRLISGLVDKGYLTKESGAENAHRSNTYDIGPWLKKIKEAELFSEAIGEIADKIQQYKDIKTTNGRDLLSKDIADTLVDGLKKHTPGGLEDMINRSIYNKAFNLGGSLTEMFPSGWMEKRYTDKVSYTMDRVRESNKNIDSDIRDVIRNIWLPNGHFYGMMSTLDYNSIYTEIENHFWSKNQTKFTDLKTIVIQWFNWELNEFPEISKRLNLIDTLETIRNRFFLDHIPKESELYIFSKMHLTEKNTAVDFGKIL